jgi:hypothetical protein
MVYLTLVLNLITIRLNAVDEILNPASVGFFMIALFQYENGNPKEDHRISKANVWDLDN